MKFFIAMMMLTLSNISANTPNVNPEEWYVLVLHDGVFRYEQVMGSYKGSEEESDWVDVSHHSGPGMVSVSIKPGFKVANANNILVHGSKLVDGNIGDGAGSYDILNMSSITEVKEEVASAVVLYYVDAVLTATLYDKSAPDHTLCASENRCVYMSDLGVLKKAIGYTDYALSVKLEI